MSSSKRNSYDNQSFVPDCDGDRLSVTKPRYVSSRNENCPSDHAPDEPPSPKITKKAQDKLSSSTTDLYSTTDINDDFSTSSDGGTVRNTTTSSVSSEQGEKKLPDSKSTISLTPTSKFLDSSDIPVPFANSSPISKDEISDRLIYNQFLIDGVVNLSPGAISQESSLFPDNTSRSSESGKSVDCSSQKTSESKADHVKADKVSLKNAEKKEKKKSSWYNMLNPTYKSKSEDFRRLFKELPDTERLIVDYSCALQKDILVHGRLYVSQNYICFYANIFRWETFVLIKCRDVTSMTKEKTARVIPNAIQITTDTEKHFFTSFGARDKTFLMLFRIWQNALLEQPMSSQELWQWVHYSYGDELGLTSDDDDYVPPPGLEDYFKSNRTQEHSKTSDKGLDKSGALNASESASDIVGEGDNLSTESLGGFGESCDQLILEGINEEPIHLEDHDASLNQKVSENPTDMSDTTESEENIEDAEIKCPCVSHEGREFLSAVFPMSVDQVFSLLFTGSKFYYDLLASRKTYDIMDSPWQICPEVGLKMRQITYTVTLNHSMAKSTHTTETQRLLKHTKPGLLYSVDCDVVNAGIPYSDTFMVKSMYCLTKVSKRVCRLRLFGCVHYKKKPMWGLVTSLIEKSAMQGLADFATDLETALNKEAECSSQQSSIKKLRRRKRMKIDPGKCDSIKDVPRVLQRQPTLRKIGQSLSGFDIARIGSNPDLVIVVILGTLLLLLFLNMLLFYKLWSLEDQSPKVVPSPAWEFPTDSLSALEREDILQLLKRQDSLHRAETEKWRDALSEVMKLIRLVENSLSDLRKSIDTYNSNSVLKTASLRNSHYTEDPSLSSGGPQSVIPEDTEV